MSPELCCCCGLILIDNDAIVGCLQGVYRRIFKIKLGMHLGGNGICGTLKKVSPLLKSTFS